MPPPTPDRVRRNSDASQHSQQSIESWRNYIQSVSSYAEDPMQHFMRDEQFVDRFAIPNGPLGQGDPRPRSDSSRSDYSVAEAERGTSTTYQSERTHRDEGSTYTSLVPTLDDHSSTTQSSAPPSTYYHSQAQMYGLQEDSSGALATIPRAGPLFMTGPRANGSYPCLFVFNMCAEVSNSKESWISHVNSHFTSRNIQPPPFSICTVCRAVFRPDDPSDNWDQFLNHLLDHYTQDVLQHEILPHPEFTKYCHEAGMLIGFSSTRFESFQRAVHEYNRTPRSWGYQESPGGSNIAQVYYPSSWNLPEPQQRTPATIEINRGGRRPRGGR